MPFSDETKDRVNAAVNVGKNILTVAWIPMIIYIGYRNSTPQPSLINVNKVIMTQESEESRMKKV